MNPQAFPTMVDTIEETHLTSEKSSEQVHPNPRHCVPGGDDIGHSPYERKARLLNEALQEIGMGRYQWGLFVVTGFHQQTRGTRQSAAERYIVA
ncbi:hypothetical protein BDZ97DRAFT_349549 [Flammula alnicola]|nr:hypothetical protein BDZ97DRAFT_349549 [Flammula alnicola]